MQDLRLSRSRKNALTLHRARRSGGPPGYMNTLDAWERLTTFHFGYPADTTDHFRNTTLDTAVWSWAGAPFATPGTVSIADSILTVTNNAGNRSFLYQSLITTDNKFAAVSLKSVTANVRVGLRLDDSSDNNYVESVLYISQGSPTQWTVQTRENTGGVGVQTASGDAMAVPLLYILEMNITGT